MSAKERQVPYRGERLEMDCGTQVPAPSPSRSASSSLPRPTNALAKDRSAMVNPFLWT